jgi:hypothetical protein
MSMRRAIGKTGLALAVTAFALIGARAASGAPAATQQATNDCWKTVVNDWLNNQPNLKGTYPVACYTQAVQHLSAYPDINQYSSAIDDIKRALLAAIHEDRGGGPPTSGGGFHPGPGGTSGPSSGGTPGGGQGQGILGDLAKRLGPGNAQSIPLPLLVLGGLALLLLLTAAATWLARRLQARRMTPAPAHARAPGSVRPKT